MSDDENGDTDENQARVYMRTSAANGFDGNEVEVTVEGGAGETVSDIADEAEERFEQAVESTGCTESEVREYQ
jgi:hypothetical protein